MNEKYYQLNPGRCTLCRDGRACLCDDELTPETRAYARKVLAEFRNRVPCTACKGKGSHETVIENIQREYLDADLIAYIRKTFGDGASDPVFVVESKICLDCKGTGRVEKNAIKVA